MRKLLLIIPLLLCCLSVSAQESNFRVAARCGLTEGLGFVNPVCGPTLGGSVGNDRVALDADVHYLFARKRPGGGHNIGGEATLRVHINQGFFVGPAVGYNRQTTNQFVKSAWAVGVEGGKVSPSGNVIVSGKFLQDLTSVNKGRTYAAKVEWYGPKRIYLAGRGSVQDFRCNQTAAGLVDHCWGTSGYASLGFYFK